MKIRSEGPAAWVVGLALSVACAATREAPHGAHTRGATETERLNAFFEQVFEQRLARDPMLQAQLGLGSQSSLWTDQSEAFEEESERLLEQAVRRMQAEFDFEALDDEGQLSWRLFQFEAWRAADNARWRQHGYPLTQMRGLHTRVPSLLLDQHPIRSVDDARAYVARLTGVPAIFAQLEAKLRHREEAGILPPAFVFPHVLGACRNIVSGRPFEPGALADSTLLADFRAKVADLELGDSERAALEAAAVRALREHVQPAYESLIALLTEQAGRADDRDGAWKLPNGGEFYEAALRRMTTTDLSADEIHALGLREVERIHGEMQALLVEVGFEGTLPEFFVHMRTAPAFFYPDDAEGRTRYLERATELIDALRARLPDLFHTLPRAPMIVRAVEPYRERSAGKAFYSPGSPDGARPGIYYANLASMADMPTYQMEALAYHEGIPGHHMQFAIAQEIDGLPRFRRYLRYTAYSEGWGLYAELVPKELGFYADPYSDFGRLAMELWRACRLVVDTGIHKLRWSRERAIAYLEANTPNPPGDCTKAIERYIVMPGQATAYLVGRNRLLELRARARRELGARFDLRTFHEIVLTSGPVPLSLLEERVMEWIAGSS